MYAHPLLTTIFLLFQTVQQSQCHVVLQPEERDEIGHHVDDRRARLSLLQRSTVHRQHHGTFRLQVHLFTALPIISIQFV